MYTHTHTHTHIYNGILFSCKVEQNVFISIKWMERLSEVSQVQKDKGLMFSFICGRQVKTNTSIIPFSYIKVEYFSKSEAVRGD
jgi:hypothetical protein